MIIANAKQQQLLLEVGKLDLAISRAQVVLDAAEKNEKVDQLRSLLLETSERLLQSHATEERLQSEIKKVAADVEMVEARIRHDETKSNQVTTEREQKAVNQELQSLKSRLSNLEDQELGLMDELDAASVQVEEVTQERTKLSLELEEAIQKQHGEALTANAQLMELASKRQAAFESLDLELQSLYSRKAQRGIAVAQTLGRDCSACRLSINAVQFESMMAEPSDNVPTCPNCDALIIR